MPLLTLLISNLPSLSSHVCNKCINATFSFLNDRKQAAYELTYISSVNWKIILKFLLTALSFVVVEQCTKCFTISFLEHTFRMDTAKQSNYSKCNISKQHSKPRKIWAMVSIILRLVKPFKFVPKMSFFYISHLVTPSLW